MADLHESDDAEREELFARGMAAGRRAAMRDVWSALDGLFREAGTGTRGPARFAPGVDHDRLERFMNVTSDRNRGGAPPSMSPRMLEAMPSSSRPPVPFEAMPSSSRPPVPFEPAPFSRSPASLEAMRDQAPTRDMDAQPVTPPPPFIASSPPPPEPEEPAHDPMCARVAAYVRTRATQLWEASKQSDVEPAARAESRAIAGELFELAEELRRGEHLKG